jgi:hypothetical protein
MKSRRNEVAMTVIKSVLTGQLGTEIIHLSPAYQLALQNVGFSESEAAETSEEYLFNLIIKRLLKQNEEHKRIYGTDLLEIDGLRCKIFHPTSVETLNAILDFSPKKFEDFCVRILESLGAIALNVGGPGDLGVDFQAKKLNLGGLTEFLPEFAKPALVGQAKRYTGTVSEPEVREFLGGAILKAREMELGICTPVIFAFWTTSKLDRAGIDTCEKYGIWYLDGPRLLKLAERQKIDLRDFS